MYNSTPVMLKNGVFFSGSFIRKIIDNACRRTQTASIATRIKAPRSKIVISLLAVEKAL